MLGVLVPQSPHFLSTATSPSPLLALREKPTKLYNKPPNSGRNSPTQLYGTCIKQFSHTLPACRSNPHTPYTTIHSLSSRTKSARHMSDSKQQHEANSALPFLHKNTFSFQQPEESIFDSHLQTKFLQGNDSNSDDTQFEIHNGELHSSGSSPAKDTTSLTQLRHHEGLEIANKFSSRERASHNEDVVEERNSPLAKENSMNNTEQPDFVDYFLAHDDILHALDDYSRSVGQTSVFPFEIDSAIPSQQCESPRATYNPDQKDLTVNIGQNNNIGTSRGLPLGEVRNNGSSRVPSFQRRGATKEQRERNREDLKQARSVSLPRRSEKRKPRTYSQAIPSQHCHICSRRPTETSPHAVCGNLLKGRCRKTICTKCFHQFRWDLKAAREAPPGTWECPHCRGECPQRAQCVIYNRTSDRRRMKLINHRKKKDQTKAPNSKKCELNRKTTDGKTESRAHSPNSGTTTINPLAIPTSCSSKRTNMRQRNVHKTEKKSAGLNGISKNTRLPGLSSHGHLGFTAEDIDEKSTQSGQRKRNISELVNSVPNPPFERAENATADAASNEILMKTEAGMLEDISMNADGQRVCDDVVGIFGYMNLPSDILGGASAEDGEKGMGTVDGGENEIIDPNISLLEVDGSFAGKGDAQCDQARLRIWDEEDMKYEQVDTAEFPFQENVLDLDTFC